MELEEEKSHELDLFTRILKNKDKQERKLRNNVKELEV